MAILYGRHMDTTEQLVAISTSLTAGQIEELDLLARHDPGLNTRAAQIRQAIAIYVKKKGVITMEELDRLQEMNDRADGKAAAGERVSE